MCGVCVAQKILPQRRQWCRRSKSVKGFLQNGASHTEASASGYSIVNFQLNMGWINGIKSVPSSGLVLEVRCSHLYYRLHLHVLSLIGNCLILHYSDRAMNFVFANP